MTLLTVLIMLLIGCTPRVEDDPNIIYFYTGEYPELYTIAMNSLLGQRGFAIRSGPGRIDSTIRVLEEDDYGRKLFIYSEDPGSRLSTFNLLISQKSNESYVYFIPHYNFISSEQPWTLILEDLDYLPEEVEELKRFNDWNQPLDLERAIRVPITRRKDGPMSRSELVSAYRTALGDAARFSADDYIIFFSTDNYGRSIYLGRGLVSGYEPGEGWIAVVMLFQPDGTHDYEKGVMQLHDFQNYQSALREFKELNRWNQPLEE